MKRYLPILTVLAALMALFILSVLHPLYAGAATLEAKQCSNSFVVGEQCFASIWVCPSVKEAHTLVATTNHQKYTGKCLIEAGLFTPQQETTVIVQNGVEVHVVPADFIPCALNKAQHWICYGLDEVKVFMITPVAPQIPQPIIT